MESYKLTTPVLLFAFNNPVTTKFAFEAIRQAKPTKLYIAAEGPVLANAGEIERCQIVRSIVTDVDWDCEVQTRFSEKYVGGKHAISSAINWFFQQESEGIVLEYDCLPAHSFFQYSSELLARYRDDKRIMAISGNRPGPQRKQEEYSYFFSNHGSTLGWATWKRAWDLHDLPMSYIESICEKGYFDNLFNTVSEADYFESLFADEYAHDKIRWNYSWEFARRINSGLTIMPRKSLVSNIGSGGIYNKVFEVNIDLPLRHPEFVMVDVASDRIALAAVEATPLMKMKSMLKRVLPHFVRKKLFEISFKKHIAAINALENGEDINSDKPGKNKKSTQPNWTILKALMDKNQMRFFSWANMSLTMCEIDLDVLYLIVA